MDTFFNVNLVKTLFIDFSCKIRNTVAAKSTFASVQKIW